MYSMITTAEKKGRAEGLMEGIMQGANQKAVEIARNLKSAGLRDNEISRLTGLDEDAIARL